MRAVILMDGGNADGSIGGGELTLREFAAAAPDDVELADSLDDADVAIVGNCATLPTTLIDKLKRLPVIRYRNDLANAGVPALISWLDENAVPIFTSPFHRLLADGGDAEIVPPALDFDSLIHPPGESIERGGAVAIAPWQNHGKGQQMLAEWARRNGPVDVYGPGPFVPQGEGLRYMGALDPADVPATLWRYEQFVHLPTDPEPFGRAVVEAWAAGCELICNLLVGALYYLDEGTEHLLYDAAERFWQIVQREAEARTPC
jgi:glycosyltransferase involved in cell wall biosynthesis